MVRAILILVVGCVVFAGGVVASYMTMARPDAPTEDKTLAEKVPARATPSATSMEAHAMKESPTVLREKPLSPEEVFRYTTLFREQEEALRRQKDLMEQRQHRLQLMEEDMRRARLELEGLRQETSAALKQGEALLQRVQVERQKTEAIRKEAKETATQATPTSDKSPTESEQSNIKQISRWFQNMPSERAAAYLQQLADDGKMHSAVQLLGNIEERDAAKILAAMSDTGLVVQLTEEFRAMKRPPKKTR